MKRSSFRMVATTGNQLIYGDDLPVYHETTNKLIPQVGQVVLWVPKRNRSISAATLGTVDNQTVNLSVVYKNAQGKKELVDINGSEWDLCNDRFRITNSLPQCAVNQKVDVFFDCVDPSDGGYSIEIVYRDSYVRALEGGHGQKAWQFNFAPKVGVDCGSCSDATLSAWTVACGLGDEINRYNKTKEMEQVGEVNTGGHIYFPIKVAVLPYGKTFHKVCLSPGNSTCSSCDTLSGLTSLVLTTIGTPNVVQTIDLSMFKENALTDPEIMLTEIAEYLETELEAIGAYVNISGGTGKCCQYELEVSGCFDSAVLNTEAGAITLTPETGVWESVPISTRCKACNEEDPANYEPKALLRFYTESILAKCSCLNVPADNLNFTDFNKEIIDIHPLEGFKVDKFIVRDTQDQVYPDGMGYHYIHMISKQSTGGRGADLWHGGGYYGQYPQEMPLHVFFDARFNIQCPTAYCAINMVVQKGSGDRPIQNSQPSTSQHETQLLIPITDALTYASVQAIWDKLAELSLCNRVLGGCFEVATSATIGNCLTGTPLAVAATRQLTASILPSTADQTGTWVSSVPGVATVSSTGLVTAVEAGTTVITFTASTGTSITATCSITVTA
jgi:Bacterial Ig-like domain (group 2)